jgi:hypothetical protein
LKEQTLKIFLRARDFLTTDAKNFQNDVIVELVLTTGIFMAKSHEVSTVYFTRSIISFS